MNKLLNRKLCTALILSTVLAVSFAYLPLGSGAEEAYVPDKVLVFLRDVVKLDLTGYTVTPSKPAFRYRDDLNGLPQLGGVVHLYGYSQDGYNEMDVMYSFINNTLNSLDLYVIKGTPQYSQPISTNTREMANGFLERYQAFTGNSDLAAMRSMLDAVDLTENSSITSGNIRQEVTIRSDSSRFSWRYTFNGAVYSGLGVEFENGVFRGIGDDTSYRGVGSTVVNITREEAVSIALKRAENYSYGFAGEEIKNFIIVKDRIGADLGVLGRDNPLLGYPYWTVSLPLDHVYPGFVYWIEVRLWADTGEVIDIKPMGYGGGVPPADTPSEDSTLTIAATAGAILTTAALTAATIIIIKKRRSK